MMLMRLTAACCASFENVKFSVQTWFHNFGIKPAFKTHVRKIWDPYLFHSINWSGFEDFSVLNTFLDLGAWNHQVSIHILGGVRISNFFYVSFVVEFYNKLQKLDLYDADENDCCMLHEFWKCEIVSTNIVSEI